MIGAELRIDKNIIPELRERLPIELRQVVYDMVEKAADIARSLAPVDTGVLRGSIDTEFGGNQFFSTGWVVVGADYGIYVEFGTKYQNAQPYLMPALDAVAPEFEARVEAAIERAVKASGSI